MFKAPFHDDKPYDDYLTIMNKEIINKVTIEDDDYLEIIAGPTGGGKSNLMLWKYEDYCRQAGIDPTLNSVCFDKESLADTFDTSRKLSKGARCVNYDEANVSKRDSLSKFNKALIDLYSSIRGLNIVHLWCNPSIEMLDKAFIKERIRGFILIGKKYPTMRYYYYFRKAEILQIMEKYERLDVDLLYKIRKKYSYYRGWFKVYDGVLKEDYLKKKEMRMHNKVDNFKKDFGGKDSMISRVELAKMLVVLPDTLAKHEKILKDNGQLNGLIVPTPGSRVYYYKEAIPLFEKSLKDSTFRMKRRLEAEGFG